MSLRDKRFNPIFPSILSTNFFDLEDKLNQFKKSNIDFIHLDVMDGNFVSNISFGPSILKAIKSKFSFKIDAHLMVDNPEKKIPWFIEAGADWISFHIETGNNIEKCINLIKNKNKKAGLALNPDTNIEKILPYVDKIDYILFMSVFPGYGGQKFITSVPNKIDELRKNTKEKDLPLIQIDGGVNLSNIGKIKDKGVESFVIGTYLYGSNNIKDTLNKLKGA